MNMHAHDMTTAALAPAILADAERAAGLDQPLPLGEQILWQAKPRARPLSRSIFRFRALAIYCVLAAAIVFALSLRSYPIGQSLAMATLLLPFALAAFGILSLIGWASARATTYTLTNRRVIMHIGVAYEMTVSVPLSAVTNAMLHVRRDGTGEIALAVSDVNNVRYIGLWPHARFGHFLKPQPMLRGIDQPQLVAEAIGEALVAFNATGRYTARPEPEQATAPARHPLPEAVAA